MRGKFHKGLFILGIAVFTGLFFQFSIDRRPVGEQEFVFKPSPPPFLHDSATWADSVCQSLDLEEKIGQLFMVAAYPEQGKEDIRRVSEMIKKHHVGGIIFFSGKPEEVVYLTRYYQSLSDVPLLIAIDGEWGASMRLSNTPKYPRQMMLGAINDDELLYAMGRDIGRQLRLLGIHINFAPVIDINNNPDNPVIGSRSFGESRENVARKGIMYMRGMQDERIIAVAKHFPGHGDTDQDSHYELPLITHAGDRLDSLELFPFRALIESGIGGIMTAHLNVPGLDPEPGRPSTLSPRIIDSLLKEELRFRGLIFTDAMTMQGVTGGYEALEANLKALQAGNDILLMTEDVKGSIEAIKKYAETDTGFADQLNERCKKVLLAKEWVLASETGDELIEDEQILDSLESPYFELLRRRLIENSLTVVSNSYDLLPLKDLESWRIAAVAVGTDTGNEFHKTLSLYTNITPFLIDETTDSARFVQISDSLRQYNLVLLSLHTDDFRTYRQYGFSDRMLEFTDELLLNAPSILTSFSSPYLLSRLKNLDENRGLIVAYENDEVTQSLAAQLLFGAISATARLPVSINNNYPAGQGLAVEKIGRLKYTVPLEAGFDPDVLKKIDSLVYNGITEKAMPGCQVLVARNGRVFMNNAYGYHTYYRKRKVQTSDLYDLASLTKILATVPVLMHLEEEKIIETKKPLADYLPELDTSNKAKLKIDDILLHQAGLQSWIPFYQDFLKPLYPNQKFARSRYSSQYPIKLGSNFYVNKHLKYTDASFSRIRDSLYTQKIVDGLYMNPALADSIYMKIYNSEVRKKGDYIYSDLGFYLFHKMIEEISGTGLDQLADSLFYRSLSATTLGYKPLERFPAERIAPTENDLILRKQVVHGYVHDPGAAMLGGVAGHAGLFSNANDLAKFSQMLLNNGSYGGIRYLDKKLIEKYTSCPECKSGNRRGLGFDKPEPDTTKKTPAIPGISPESFGHTGFTGTMVWMDPETGILYIFLSNRVYPDASSNKLSEMDIRTNIQQAVYDAIID